MMYYWRLQVKPDKYPHYVFYKTAINLSKINVPRHAVIDGELLDVFLPYVDQIEEIPSELYYEYMSD